MNKTGISRFALDGKTALVTGASRGIGASLAINLAEAGADVALLARSTSALEEIAGEIRALGRQSLVLTGDVRSRKSVDDCVAKAWEKLGVIDILINAAGGPMFQAPILNVREEGFSNVLDLNLTSVLRVAQLVGGRMVKRGAGSIINIASVLPTRAWPAIASYSAAKSAVISLTQAMAVEWGAAGVRVNALCPGWIRTGLNQTYTEDPAQSNLAVDAVPLARWGESGDLAGAAIWLASDAARYVTGALIPVDGGLAIGLSEQWQRQMQLEDHSRRPS